MFRRAGNQSYKERFGGKEPREPTIVDQICKRCKDEAYFPFSNFRASV